MIQDEVDVVIERPPGPLDRLLLPSSLVAATIRGLRGYAPFEGLCYWFGRELQPGVAIAMVTAFPRISSTERSFWVLDGELSRLLEWADEEKFWLLSQIHTQPADETHSTADQQWAPTYRTGFLSVI